MRQLTMDGSALPALIDLEVVRVKALSAGLGSSLFVCSEYIGLASMQIARLREPEPAQPINTDSE